METIIYNTKQFLITDFLLSGVLCTTSMLLIILVWRKRKNLSKCTKCLLLPLLVFIMNTLLTDTIYFNHLLKMYNQHVLNSTLKLYTQMHDGYFSYIISFVALLYIYIYVEKEEDNHIISKS